MSTAVEPPASMAVKPRTGLSFNWVGAFLLYAKGAMMEEISTQMDMPLPKIRSRARAEDWDGMMRMNKLALRAPDSNVSATSAIVLKNVEKRIEENREAALAVAHGLRSHIQKILRAYEDEKVFLGPADIQKLAGAARSIDESAMLALGDDPSPKIAPDKGASKDGTPVKGAGAVTHFHIHPPAQALKPRVVRQVGEITGPEAQGLQVDAVMTPTPRRQVEIEAESDSISITTENGRASVDFSKLKREVESVPLPKGLPAFAKTS